jgi:hypothetical protein
LIFFDFFIDTEGTQSTDNDETYDAKLFSICIFLSSLFLFNSVGSIEETHIA